jgi:hypothetical protein
MGIFSNIQSIVMPEHEGTTALQDVEHCLSKDAVSHPRRPEFADRMVLRSTGCGGKEIHLHHHHQVWNLIL